MQTDKKTKPPYSQDFLIKQKAKLYSELATLEQQNDVSNEVEESPEINPEEAAGDVDRQFTCQAKSAVLDKKINAIKFSIAQIENGQYGLCQSCQKWIPQSRLEIVPTATKCANCS